MMARPAVDITPTAASVLRQPERAASRGSPAPRCWPTRVEAAVEKPSPGTNEKERMRTPIM
jgi:hypothetical protein